MRAASTCAEPRCPRPATRDGRCNLHRRRTVQGRARLRRYERLAARDGNRCHDCRARNVPLVQSHDVPLALGGRDVDANIRLRCGRCHRDHDASYGIAIGGSALG